MPNYDLACEGCEARFEAFRQGFLRDEDRMCPVRRGRSAPALHGVPDRASSPAAGLQRARRLRRRGCCGGSCGCG